MRQAAMMLLVLLHAGSIFDSHKRRAVQPLMYVRLASLATETGVLGEGLLAALPSQTHQLLPVRGVALSSAWSDSRTWASQCGLRWSCCEVASAAPRAALMQCGMCQPSSRWGVHPAWLSAA